MALAIIFSPESQRRLHEADKRWQLYAILRLVALGFSLIGFSLFASAIPIWNRYFYWGSGPNRGDWQDGFPLAVLVFAFLWNVVALYLLLIRKKAIKPFIPLIFDFLVWAALVPAVTWSTGLGMFLNWTDRVEDYVSPELWHILVEIGRRELVAVVFSCFVWAIEISLFIFACIDTHHWRKSRKTTHSIRALDHGDLAQDAHHHHHQQQANEPRSPTGNNAPAHAHAAPGSPPPKYEEYHGHGQRNGNGNGNHWGRDIEMGPTSPTSPTARGFT